ncbi:hypothetical protein [Crocosphaera sp. XPORK-15E]|uniref:hypothetical protein n=1 Tax=Crocosphaera sp. XPORK-15E TaxID=3110247 RepID=UPI002B1F7C9E|nr:hypothetical protein [Crocosphaera sp. XPORK-15E]MEA5536856.1 hypothetical protein [Crocosphaera sp. XPORK-15E]
MATEISPLELALQSRLSKLKPKTKTPGFLRSVVERQSLRIESALGMGYSYDEIAELFSEQGFKCKGSTLKKYHLQVKKLLDDQNSPPIPELPEKKEATQSTQKKS